MKFSSTVDSLSRENRHLRQMLGGMTLGIILLSTAVLLLYDKSSKLVMRSSRGLEIVSPIPLQRTESDVREATRLMLNARLNTDTIAPEVFLTKSQLELRTAEQRELKSRDLFQAIVVRGLEIHDNSAIVSFDRIISVGDVRSAIQTKANIAFEEAEPNELNPYGLKLASLAPIDQPKQANKGDGK